MLRLLFLLVALACGGVRGAGAGDALWEVWDDCRFESDKYFDGDSFHISHGRTSAIIRLYFVDAPETDDGYGGRIAEQAAYFRTTPEAVLRGGAHAKELTAGFLAGPFRVVTRRQIAPGASRSERYYGIVERNGRRLDAALVTAGLARVSAEMAEYPDAATARRAVLDLRAFELQASKARRGLWVRSGFVGTMSEILKARIGAGAQGRRINLNTATAAELASLPGIGPKMAQQIIRARPITNIEGLDAIPGFGPKKIAALNDLISF